MKLRWTEPAANDLKQICDYLGEPGGVILSRRVALVIHEAIAKLAQFPESGRIGRNPGTRELVLTSLPYLAIYRVRPESIEILRILRAAQKWA